MKRKLSAAFLSAISLLSSSPAWADDWTATCRYQGGTIVKLKYEAGDGAVYASILRSGSEYLETDIRPKELSKMITPHGRYYISARPQIFDQGWEEKYFSMNFIIWVDVEHTKSYIEAGTDDRPADYYFKAQGTCVFD